MASSIAAAVSNVVTAALSASLVSLVLLDAASIYIIVRKLELYTYGGAMMVFGRDKRWSSLKIDRAAISRMQGVRRKRLILIRHGESEWNLVFNVGSKVLMPFKAAAALWREMSMLIHLDPGSVLYDSPLNQQGFEQAQEIAAFLREEEGAEEDEQQPPAGAKAPKNESRSSSASDDDEARRCREILRGSRGAETAVVVTSNLRRAAQTIAIALQDRLTLTAKNKTGSVHVLSSIQEVSTNIDTISVTPPYAAPSLPRVPDLLQQPSLFETTANYGNKPLRGNGLQRIVAFTRWAFHRDEQAIIVGGHSLWFRALFRELMPIDEAHVAKDAKIDNGGIISCFLEQGYSNGQLIYVIRPETVVAVHKGFDVKKAARKSKDV